jgi:hypothetical protein
VLPLAGTPLSVEDDPPFPVLPVACGELPLAGDLLDVPQARVPHKTNPENKHAG